MSDADFEQRLEQLLAEALERLERGEDVDLEALCAGEHEMLPVVEAALARAGRLPQMHEQAGRVDPLIGVELIGRYRVVERVGAGAMGAVYRGFDGELQRSVAIKILRPEYVVGEQLDARLEREGQVLASIRDPGVVTIYDRGRAADGRAFLVMELLRGVTAAELLVEVDEDAVQTSGRERLLGWRRLLGEPAVDADSDVRQAVQWIAAAAAGLQAAHEAGVVHRDVKPSNLFLEKGGRVAVLDFGIVSLGSHVTLDATGSPLGTPAFMAPEQLESSNKADPRSDVYGLGATLYHLLTGRPPFLGTPQQVISSLTRKRPTPADQVRPGLPRDLVAIVEAAMAFEPRHRYASVAEMRRDLEAWLDHRPVSVRRVSPLVVLARRLRRSPFVRGAAAVVLALLVFLAVQAWRGEQARLHGEEWNGLFAQVPPSLLMAPPKMRATSAVTSSPAVRRRLDRMVELGVDPTVSLALRAILRSDAGDLQGAADDLDRIAQQVAVEFTARAAAIYREGKLPDELAQQAEPPEVASADDAFVVAVHALRSAGWPPTWLSELLAEEKLGARPGFAEVRLLAELILARFPSEEVERRPRYRALREAVAGLKVIRRGYSALTSQILANALLAQKRDQEALAVAIGGRDLAPDDFSLCVLSGSAAIGLGQFDAAAQMLRRAIEMQPLSVQAHNLLLTCLGEKGEFDDAQRVLEAASFGDGRRAELLRTKAEAMLLYRRALHTCRREVAAGQPASESRRLAGRARALFARLSRSNSGKRSYDEINCDLLVAPDPALVLELLDVLSDAPTDPNVLRDIALVLHDVDLSLPTEALVSLLKRQALILRGGDR